jgi:transposase-like protein
MDTKNNSPKTLLEAVQYFSNPETALAFMVKMRWPDGVKCPTCGAPDVRFISTRRIWECKAKHHHKQFTVKVGTIMEDSPISLEKWLPAIWLLTSAKNGISSYEIHRALGVTQKTAWFMLHRIRLALKSGSFQKASGTVEVDETYVGGKVGNFKKSKIKALRIEAKKMKPLHPVNLSRLVKKTIVAGVLERGTGDKKSQMRAMAIESTRRHHLKEVVYQNVEAGSEVMTDALPSYKGLKDQFIHSAIDHAVKYAEGRVHTNGVENFWSLLKRTIRGTYVAIEPFHIDAYLDEQCFRFNLRALTDGQRFAQALGGVTGRRLTYAELTGKTGASPVV